MIDALLFSSRFCGCGHGSGALALAIIIFCLHFAASRDPAKKEQNEQRIALHCTAHLDLNGSSIPRTLHFDNYPRVRRTGALPPDSEHAHHLRLSNAQNAPS